MQELIRITVQNDQQLVSARDLYKGLELKIRFSLWVSKNFDSFEEGQDFTSVSADTEVSNNGGVTRPATIKDLQDLNSEIIASICDQLGMSDICLGGNKK